MDISAIIEKMQEHKFIVLGSMLGVLILLMLLAVMLLINENKKPAEDPNEIMITIDPSVFILPEEPLELPPVQYSRKQKKTWTEEDLQYWYTIPNEEQMRKLHDANEKQMQKLWESVP